MMLLPGCDASLARQSGPILLAQCMPCKASHLARGCSTALPRMHPANTRDESECANVGLPGGSGTFGKEKFVQKRDFGAGVPTFKD